MAGEGTRKLPYWVTYPPPPFKTHVAQSCDIRFASLPLHGFSDLPHLLPRSEEKKKKMLPSAKISTFSTLSFFNKQPVASLLQNVAKTDLLLSPTNNAQRCRCDLEQRDISRVLLRSCFYFWFLIAQCTFGIQVVLYKEVFKRRKKSFISMVIVATRILWPQDEVKAATGDGKSEGGKG